MNINGIITKEEKDEITAAYLKRYRATKILYLVGRILLLLYTLMALLLAFYGFAAKQGLCILVFLLVSPIIIYDWKNNIKRPRLMKLGKYFSNTDKALSNPQEYHFCADDEKITVNDTISINYSDIKTAFVFNGYTLVATKDKLPVIIKTDFEQQWQLFQIFIDTKTLVYTAAINKKEAFANQQIIDYAKTVSLKKEQKRKRKQLGTGVAITAAAYLCMLLTAGLNNNSARDKNRYSYDKEAEVYFTSQMAEKYAETKSYKPMHDIFFDWRAQSQTAVVAINKQQDTITSIDIYYKNNNGNYNIKYTDNPDRQIRTAEKQFVIDWDSGIKSLSDYDYLAKNYPYITNVMSVLGLDIELSLKDNSIFTLDDNWFCIFTPSFYSSGNDDNYYVVYMADIDDYSAEQMTYYFNSVKKECEKPYAEQNIDIDEMIRKLDDWCKIEIAH